MAVTFEHLTKAIPSVLKKMREDFSCLARRMLVNLPIQIVPNTSPPQFEWQQLVSTPNGVTSVKHVGAVQPSMETALRELIELVEDLAQENERLRRKTTERELKRDRG